MRPKIALYCDSFQDKVAQSVSYVEFASKFGEAILVTPSNDLNFWLQEADILLLPGGADVDPSRYGEKPEWRTSRVNPHYEYLDEFLLKPWLNTGKPIIGICRGLQTLNVAAGGTLHQHVNNHSLIGKKGDRSDPTHSIFTDMLIEFEDEWKDYRIHPVNSFHHQAIRKLAPGFEMLGWATLYAQCPSLAARKDRRHSHIYERVKGNGGQFKIEKEDSQYVVIPEIIRHKEQPFIAFQYHPEEFNDDLATHLIWHTLAKAGFDIPYEVKIKTV